MDRLERGWRDWRFDEGKKRAYWKLGSDVGFLSLRFQKENHSGVLEGETVWSVTMDVGWWNIGEGHWSWDDYRTLSLEYGWVTDLETNIIKKLAGNEKRNLSCLYSFILHLFNKHGSTCICLSFKKVQITLYSYVSVPHSFSPGPILEWSK